MIDSDRIAAIEARCEAANAKPIEEMRTQDIAQMRADNKRLIEACNELLQKTQQLEAEAKRLREAQRWIPVSERLPEVGKCVLIRQTYHAILGEHGEYEGITVGYLHQPTDRRGKPYFYWAAVSDYGDMVRAQSICPGNEFITHWMPLPAPPEEGKQI